MKKHFLNVKRVFTVVALCLCGILGGFAQIDTVFWFAPPDLDIDHQQIPIQLCFTTYGSAATITVEQPTNYNAFPTMSFTIPADSFYVLDVSNWVDDIESKPANTVLNRGFRISATDFISCYYESVGNNSEMYTLKGSSGLGTDFLVPMQVAYSSNSTTSTSSIEIIATEDNTMIQITAPVALQGGIAAGNTVTVTLQRGQTYVVRAAGTSASDHLHNTVIHSSKPIVVNSSDDSVASGWGCVDLIGDQLVPINMTGRRYVAIRNYSSYEDAFERVFVFSLQNNTTVWFNGVPQTVSQGSFIDHLLTDTATLITSNNPIIAFQITATGCEQGGTMLPHLECTGSYSVSHLRPNIESMIVTLVTETIHTSNFTLNGNPNAITASDFHPLANDPTLSYCLKDISNIVPTGTVMKLANSSGRFQLGILDGDGSGSCSYGFFSDYARSSYVQFEMDSLYCVGDSIVFHYSAPNVDNLVLTGPNGFQLTTLPFALANADSTMSGWYYLEGADTASCLNVLSDSVYISVSTCSQPNLPDNVDSADCTVSSTGHDWGIVLDWASAEMVSPLVIPLVGDIDGDGVPEIVCLAPNDNYNYYGSTQVMIFNTITHQLIHTINLPETVSTNDAAPYGIVKLPNGHVILVVALINQTLHAYDLTAMGTTPLWSANTDSYGPNVSFTDFNSDSYPEIYIGNKIYDAETGTLLISNPNITHTASSYAHHNETPFGHAPSSLSSPCVANLVGDSKPDLILGNEIYEVLITNRNGLAGNSITLSKSITPPSGISADGHPQVADFNLDGHLDVFVSKKDTTTADVGCYVWDVHNNTVSNALIIPVVEGGKSIPLIADVDNDDTLEMVIQCNASIGNKVKCYKYDIISNNFTFMWDIGVDEDSYSNSMTLFDFNNDGENDLLISDQTTVRIVNGSGHSHLTGNDTIPVYTLTTLNFGECTVMQYPVVADVDADGSAEIVICGLFGSGHTYQAYLNIFHSSTNPWAPARKVWNQYMYNVTNINEDLTVPLHLFNNATPFTDPQGVVRRPFNNFLQQATTIDQYGRPFYAVPDVAMNTTTSSQIVGDSLVLTFSYCNLGDNMLNAPYPVTVFANTYGGGTLGTVIMGDNLPVDSCAQGEIHLAASDLCSMQGLDTLVIAVNCVGNGIAQNGGLQPECDTTNNTVSVAIEALSVSVLLTEQACDSYTWNGTTYSNSGTYTVSYTNGYGCDSIVTLQLTIHPSLESEDNLTLCENQLPYTYDDTVFALGTPSSATFVLHRFTSAGCDSTVTLHLTVNPTGLTEYYDSVCQNTAYSGYGFSLSENETATSGSHTFDRTLTNQFGCDSVIRLNLYVKPVITPVFYADPDRALLSENSVINFVNNTNIVELVNANYYWVWDFGDGASDTTFETETSHLYTNWGDYTVVLTLWADGCMDSASVSVFIEADLEFPNVITPNGDGINDVFVIKNLNPARPNRLYITDRWGKAVWHKDNYQTYMKDGQIYNAESGFGMGNISDGVYYYAFYYEGMVRTVKFNGSITVIR